MRDIFYRKETDDRPMFRPAVLRLDDPRRIRVRMAPMDRPPMEVILARGAGRLVQEEEEVQVD